MALAVRRFPGVLRETGSRFIAVEGFTRAAALSHYALFSVFPALLLSVTAFGVFLGDGSHARREFLDVVDRTMTPALRNVLDDTLASLQDHRAAGGISATVGLVGLLWGATGAFVELDTALRKIFDSPIHAPARSSIFATVWQEVRTRLVAQVVFFARGEAQQLFGVRRRGRRVCARRVDHAHVPCSPAGRATQRSPRGNQARATPARLMWRC